MPRIDTDDIEGVKDIIGKVLIHVYELDPKSGCGYVFCFGHKRTDTEGPMVAVRMEEVRGRGPLGGGKGNVLRFYYTGRWKDKEIIVN